MLTVSWVVGSGVCGAPKDKKILSLNVSQASAANQVEKVKPLSYMSSIEEDLNN